MASIHSLCRKKVGWFVEHSKRAGQNKAAGGWESSYFSDELSIAGIDPIDFDLCRQNQSILAPSFMGMHELEADSVNFMVYSDQFIQLPQLDSPSLTLLKNEEDDLEKKVDKICKKVIDWRAFDKFVVSQLSHEDI